MLHAALRKTEKARQLRAAHIPTVCVVDPHAGDYQGWDALAEAHGARLQIVATADEALRFARSNPVDLWVVNTTLPGLSGYELCSMLKARSSRSPVYLVSDDYSPAAEQAAWQARATLFGCKGAHGAWLEHFVASNVNSTLTPSQENLHAFAS